MYVCMSDLYDLYIFAICMSCMICMMCWYVRCIYTVSVICAYMCVCMYLCMYDLYFLMIVIFKYV
jgi:hypothetical protein